MLFVTAAVPNTSGQGTAMRAGLHLRYLSGIFDVTLLIISGVQQNDPEKLARVARDFDRVTEIIVPRNQSLFDRLWLANAERPQMRIVLEALCPTPVVWARNEPRLAGGVRGLAGRHFDAVHCFRLHTAPALSLLRRAGIGFDRCVLDIDDYESRTALRLAQAFGRYYGRQRTLVKRLEALKWRVLERFYINRFDVCLVCSEDDKIAFTQRFPDATFAVVPNTVERAAPHDRQAGDVVTLLFVGSLDYDPNVEGMKFFVSRVWPLIRAEATREVRLMIVGRAPGSEILTLGREPGVTVVGSPPDVGPYYAAADVAIAPIRSGGGTRIKILEAFSHGVPVVSTTIGAEGLDARAGQDLLIADAPEEMARACLDLIDAPERRAAIARDAMALFEERFSEASLKRHFAPVYPGVETGAAGGEAVP
jgi:glycosyltransferase involved in cell wall biosynthesis